MKKGTLSTLLGLLLIATALSLFGYNLWADHRAGINAQVALDNISQAISSNPIPKEGRVNYKKADSQIISDAEIEYPDYVLNPHMDMPAETVDGIRYIGKLSIPAIDIELPVCESWDYNNLNIAPCRYTGTAYLDNMVICAHNYDNHFGQIKNLRYGDSISFTDMDGNVFNYEVIEVIILQPTSIEEMTTGDWDLTLFTCTIGGATRVTVRCEKK